MAIAFSTSGTNTGDTNNLFQYSTSSFSAPANSLIIVFYYSSRAGASPSSPTCTGGGLTYSQIATITGPDFNRLTVFRAVNTSAQTMSCTGQNAEQQNGGAITAFCFTGTATTGTNGANAIRQSNTASSLASATSVTVTLASGVSGNATIMGGGWPRNQTGSGDGGSWSAVGISYGSPAGGMLAQYLLGNDTSITAGTGLVDVHLGIAAEIVAATAPTVTTGSASSITTTGADLAGNVTADGGRTVSERGVVVSTSSNPTTSDSKFTSGSGTGTFTATASGLSPNTLYHYRAYAINNIGTSYGSDQTFTTDSAGGTPTLTLLGVG